MAKKDVIEAVGTVVDAQPNAMFKVRLEKIRGAGAYFRQDKNEPHKDSSGR